MIHYVIVEKCINTIDDVLLKKALSFIEYKHIYNSYLKVNENYVEFANNS